MIESIASALLVYLGQKTIDRFWGTQRTGNSSIVNQTGNLEYTGQEAGRTQIRRDFTVSQQQQSELLVGAFYIPDVIRQAMSGYEVPIVLIIEETQQQVFLFDADLDAGYQIYLPYGIFSIYIFLVDSRVASLFDADIYAIGFPSGVDLSNIERFDLEHPDDVWDLINEAPIQITRGGPFYLDFILLDTEGSPEYPTSFAELLPEQIDCPRCGGDGFVSAEDLNQLLALGYPIGDWQPGACRLCEGAGWVYADFENYRDVGNTLRERRRG